TAMVAINTLEIVYRVIYIGGLNWVQELSLILAMTLYFFAYALIAKNREYIRIELFTRLLGPLGRRRVGIATRLLVLLFHAMLVWYAWETTLYSRLFETSVLAWPEWVFYAPILLGCIDIVITEAIYLAWQLRSTNDSQRPHEHVGVLR
ncbi:MAG: TRAP transporter small permease subunit, partial [Variovorax sp.]